ncbi:AMP-binding protein [Actinomycetaceae bacterium TAE3-ERU4]|nr:AMP-binding protein [Actinomycetaceae bacterium TAE3-ERU4]
MSFPCSAFADSPLGNRQIFAFCADKVSADAQRFSDFLLSWKNAPDSPVLLPLPPNDNPADVLAEVCHRIREAHLKNGEQIAQVWANTDLIVQTSGSTSGKGKLVGIGKDALCTSARATWDFLLPPAKPTSLFASWVRFLPSHHISGWQVIFRALLGKALHPALAQSNLFVGGEKPFIPDFIDVTRQALSQPAPSSFPLLFTSLVPTQLKRILESQEGIAAAKRYERVLVGGAHLDEKLLRDANLAGIRVSTTYGACETSGGCFYDGYPLPTFPPPRADICPDGRIRISSPTLFSGYLCDQSFSETLTFPRKQWITNDLGEVSADGHLRVLGRADDVIITGGVKVLPSAVETELLSHPAIQEALVVGVKSEEWGQEVCALLVSKSGVRLSIQEVRDFVSRNLGKPAAPKRIIWIETLPLLGIGKPDREKARHYFADCP